MAAWRSQEAVKDFVTASRAREPATNRQREQAAAAQTSSVIVAETLSAIGT